MVHPGGFEPPTARFVAEYSIQLSYGFEPPTARFVAEYSIQLSYGCIGIYYCTARYSYHFESNMK